MSHIDRIASVRRLLALFKADDMPPEIWPNHSATNDVNWSSTCLRLQLWAFTGQRFNVARSFYLNALILLRENVSQLTCNVVLDVFWMTDTTVYGFVLVVHSWVKVNFSQWLHSPFFTCVVLSTISLDVNSSYTMLSFPFFSCAEMERW